MTMTADPPTQRTDNIALFDMDGTLCNYVGAIIADLEKLRAPDEPFVDPFTIRRDNTRYQYLWRRMDLIKSQYDWWANLPRLQLGFDVLRLAEELGYSNEILTQSPKDNPAALAGKQIWIKNELGDIDYTMTRNKSRHYGRLFVDDHPGYIESWLTHRKNGLVIMPVNNYNKDFSHPQVVRYDGTNLSEVRAAMKAARQ